MEKKIIGTSDAWSTGSLSQKPSKPAYYIVHCRIFGGVLHILTQLGILPSPVMPNSSLPALNAFRIAKATLQPINIAGSPVAFDPKVPSFLFLRIIQLVYVSCIRLIWFRKKTLWFVAKKLCYAFIARGLWKHIYFFHFSWIDYRMLHTFRMIDIVTRSFKKKKWPSKSGLKKFKLQAIMLHVWYSLFIKSLPVSLA